MYLVQLSFNRTALVRANRKPSMFHQTRANCPTGICAAIFFFFFGVQLAACSFTIEDM